MSRRTDIMKRTRSVSKLDSGTATEVSKTSITVLGIFAVIVGLWSFACIIGGMVAGGGPQGLVAGWFRAVSGL